MADRKDLLAKIHIAKKDLGLDDDVYREMLKNHFGKDSAGDLTMPQLWKCVNLMHQKGWQVKGQSKRKDVKPERTSEKQWKMIKWLQGQLAWTDHHLENYVKHVTKIDSMKFLDVPNARLLITGMRQTLTFEQAKNAKTAQKWHEVAV